MTTNTDQALAVEMRGITKKFPGVIANDNVDFEVRRGEVHTLLGENGAGKSTLMQVLSGLYQPNAGEILVQGQKVDLKSPRDSMDAGIGMVYQRFMLVKKHTVVENVILGLQEFGAVINYRKAIRKIRDISQEYKLHIDPEAHIWNLSIGEQQRVEIVKMLFRNVEILILDEPTAVLTPQEAKELFNTVRVLTGQGKSIIFISHKLNEVMEISDRITILRKGEKVTTVRKEDTDERGLANLMVGREVLMDIQRKPTATEEEVLAVSGVTAVDDRFLPALQGVDLRVHKGEILGLAGVSGNGQRELEQVLTGLRQPTHGTIILGEKDISELNPGEIIRDGMACIPSDRHGVGTVPGLDFMTNIILKTYRYPPIASGIFLNYKVAREEAGKLQEEFDIQVPSLSSPVRLLSGGNLQKVIIAREVTSNPKFLLAVHPTRGLDIGATKYVRQNLEKLKQQGVAILLISEDLEELISLSDRIAAIYEGKITGTVPTCDATIEKLGLLMTGQAI
ncbi:MAG: ABC transporter ATP-binding protein [Candidatus Auribacterota bacterium]|nr:ABC transporter ATP-binding protein [Candidatus Auribacterota bacterium]